MIFDERGLARAVFPHQADDLALVDRQADVAQGGDAGEMLADVAQAGEIHVPSKGLGRFIYCKGATA